MELRRSRGGKAALVVGGNSFIKYITIGPHCPVFAMMPLKEFNEEFNANLSMSTEDAALAFLRSAKRAFKHNPDVITFLLDKIIMKNIAEMSLLEVTACYNRLCVAAGKKPRKAFDSKAKALEAIEQLDAITKLAEPEQILAAEKSAQRNRSNAMTQNTDGTVKEAKPRGKGIGAMAMELLIAGKTTAEVIAEVKDAIPDANPTPATIAWYKNKLRQEGKLPKPEKKEKVAKAPKAKKAAVADEGMGDEGMGDEDMGDEDMGDEDMGDEGE